MVANDIDALLSEAMDQLQQDITDSPQVQRQLTALLEQGNSPSVLRILKDVPRAEAVLVIRRSE